MSTRNKYFCPNCGVAITLEQIGKTLGVSKQAVHAKVQSPSKVYRPRRLYVAPQEIETLVCIFCWKKESGTLGFLDNQGWDWFTGILDKRQEICKECQSLRKSEITTLKTKAHVG